MVTQGTNFSAAAITGAGGLVVTAGSLALTANNAYTGGTVVNGGTLGLNVGGTSGALMNTLTINPGGTVELNATNALGYSGSHVTTAYINGGVMDDAQPAGGNGNEGLDTNFNLTAGTLTSSGGGAYQFNLANVSVTSNGSTASSVVTAGLNMQGNSLTFNVSQGSVAGGVDLLVTGVISGAYPIAKTGAGTLLLTASNTYTGGTTVSGGVLELGNSAALGLNTAALAVNAGTLNLNGFSPTVGAVNGAGTINNVSAGGSLTLTVGSGGAGGAFSGTIQNTSGTLSLVKTGAGTQTLSGTNTFSGGTQLNGGILNFTASALPHALPNSIIFGGGTLQYAAGNTADVSAAIAPIASGQAAIIDTGANSVSFASPLSGSGGLTKAGAGLLTLLGANAYSGSTRITAGTLQIGNGGSLGSLPSVSPITDNATLAFSRSDSVTQGINFGSVITGSGGLVQAGPGTLVLNGSNNYTGVTTVKAGLLEIATSGSLYGGNSASWTATNIIVAGGATLAVTIGGPSDFSANGGAQAAALLARRVARRFVFRLRHHQLGDFGLGARGDGLVGPLPKRRLSEHADHWKSCIRYFQARHGDLGPPGLQRQQLHGRHLGGQWGTGDAGRRCGGCGERDERHSAGHDRALGPEQPMPWARAQLDEAVGPGQLERHGRQFVGFHSRDWGQAGHQPVTGNTWDFAYGVVPAGSTPGKGQISLSPSASGGNNSGAGFAAFNASSLSTPRIVGLLAVSTWPRPRPRRPCRRCRRGPTSPRATI